MSFTITRSSGEHSGQSKILQSLLEKVGLDAVPSVPVHEKGVISVNFRMLHCDPSQLDTIKQVYAENHHFHKIFNQSESSQMEARKCLQEQKLILEELDDLGNGWSRRWSTTKTSIKSWENMQRILFQCQSGTSSAIRHIELQRQNTHKNQVHTGEKGRQMPFDFTGCLGHLDLTFVPQTLTVYRITGILDHNDECKSRIMSRLPKIPVHPHVWQDALEQLNNGAADISAVRKRNQDLFRAGFYHGQKDYNLGKANHRYELLPGDSRSLYRKQALSFGVDLNTDAVDNIDTWLRSDSPMHRPEIASDVYFYQRQQAGQHYHFMLCIQTPYMKSAAWEYAHGKQLILDGTFEIDKRISIFIAFGADEQNRGTPLAFFISSAPAPSTRLEYDYDPSVLTHLLRKWVESIGTREGRKFAPKVIITDMDTKQHDALLLSIWPEVQTVLLSKDHTRHCWTRKKKSEMRMAETNDFYKDLMIRRLQDLEQALINTETYESAIKLIASEETWIKALHPAKGQVCQATLNGALSYLRYLTDNWMPMAIWQSWSAFGRTVASKILGINNAEDVIPTTNPLEPLIGIFQRKYIFKNGARRLRVDLFIMLLITHTLPSIYKQQAIKTQYYDWLTVRFGSQIHDSSILEKKKPNNLRVTESKATTVNAYESGRPSYAVTWWTSESQTNFHDSAQYILANRHIGYFQWLDPYTLEATCMSSPSDTDSEVDGHVTHYRLSVNVYGLAACTCTFNSSGNGACKHLWAFRYILPSLFPSIAFHFPTTEQAALDIYAAFFPNPPPLNLSRSRTSEFSASVGRSNSQLPSENQLDPMDTLTMSSESESEGSGTESEADSDHGAADDNDSNFEVASESSELARADAARQVEELQKRTDDEIAAVLPQLRNIIQLMEEGKDILHKVPRLPEFKRVVSRLNDLFSETGVTGNNGAAELESDGQDSDNDRDSFPPSSERTQKRKRSTIT